MVFAKYGFMFVTEDGGCPGEVGRCEDGEDLESEKGYDDEGSLIPHLGPHSAGGRSWTSLV